MLLALQHPQPRSRSPPGKGLASACGTAGAGVPAPHSHPAINRGVTEPRGKQSVQGQMGFYGHICLLQPHRAQAARRMGRGHGAVAGLRGLALWGHTGSSLFHTVSRDSKATGRETPGDRAFGDKEFCRSTGPQASCRGCGARGGMSSLQCTRYTVALGDSSLSSSASLSGWSSFGTTLLFGILAGLGGDSDHPQPAWPCSTATLQGSPSWGTFVSPAGEGARPLRELAQG